MGTAWHRVSPQEEVKVVCEVVRVIMGGSPGPYGVSTMDSVHAPSIGVETDKSPGLAEPLKQWC